VNIRVGSIADLRQVTDVLSDYIGQGFRHFLLSGDLGSGKTTLVQTFCQQAQVPDPVNSPTFSLVNAYESSFYGTIYHMDLYRLDREEDLQQIGLDEYLDSGKICFIEWPRIAEAHFQAPFVRIDITVEPDNIRTFRITTYDAVDA
jgi:tRNA threonylcarbamoyladenosine biosynthesis protein TsaE